MFRLLPSLCLAAQLAAPAFADARPTMPSGRMAAEQPDPRAGRSPAPARYTPPRKFFPRNVRLATYNVKQLHGWLDNDGNHHDDNGEPLTDLQRVRRIADRILRSDLEIVAPNEVFNEEARDEFARRLGQAYPYYVSKLDQSTDVEDSGLMLFSRHPFAPMDLDPWNEPGHPDGWRVKPTPFGPVFSVGVVRWVNGDGVVRDTSDGYVGAQFFTCDDEYDWEVDCAAAKGVGLVKIRLPMGEDLFVAFSHMVASYSSDTQDELCAKRDDRLIGLRQAEALVLDGAESASANIVLLGDLNIDGNPHTHVRRRCKDDQWSDIFDPDTALHPVAACGDYSERQCVAGERLFVDAWAFDTSTEDLGRTASFPYMTDLADTDRLHSGARLDYVLYRGGSISHGPLRRPGMVPQHLSIPHKLAGISGNLSDHLPVAVDMLLPRRADRLSHVTPRLARPLTATVTEDGLNAMTLTEPGQVQWTLFEALPGTYRLWTEGMPMGFEVYAPHDLSRPVRARHVDGQSATYALPDPPYYIKTFAAKRDGSHDRLTTGAYRIGAHRHDCQSPREACILIAGVHNSAAVAWRDDRIGVDDAQYFEFLADDTDEEGVEPEHTFEISAVSTGGTRDAQLPLVPEVVTFDSNRPVAGVRAVSHLADARQRTVRLGGLRGRDATPSYQSYLLKVRRTNPDFMGVSYITHSSNITYFMPVGIAVHQEDDASAHDELWISLTPGTRVGNTIHPLNVHRQMDDFMPLPLIDEREDDGAYWPAQVLGQRRYVTGLSMAIVEDDDEDGDFEEGDLLLGEPNLTNILRSPNGHVLQPIRGGHRLSGRWIWSNETEEVPPKADRTDYMYTLDFRLSTVPPCLAWPDLSVCR